MKATIWKIAKNTTTYSIQIDNVTNKSYNKVLKSIKGWTLMGEGWRKEQYVILANRNFPDKKSLECWADDFPYELYYTAATGKISKMKSDN